MKLYEYDEAITNALDTAIDPDTGEIIDDEAYRTLDSYLMGRNDKIENILLWVKSLTADAAAIKTEEAALKERRERKERKAENVKNFIQRYLGGEKFETPKVAVSYRRSESVEVFGDVPPEYQRIKTTVEPDKTKLKDALKAGEVIEGAALVKKVNMSIK